MFLNAKKYFWFLMQKFPINISPQVLQLSKKAEERIWPILGAGYSF
jgi:hypothetical protein